MKSSTVGWETAWVDSPPVGRIGDYGSMVQDTPPARYVGAYSTSSVAAADAGSTLLLLP